MTVPGRPRGRGEDSEYSGFPAAERTAKKCLIGLLINAAWVSVLGFTGQGSEQFVISILAPSNFLSSSPSWPTDARRCTDGQDQFLPDGTDHA